MEKPINAKAHGIIDYAFSGIQLLGPILLGLNKPAKNTYLGLGAGFLGVNSLTDTPVGLKRVLSLKDHQKVDAGFLAALSLLTLTKMLRKDKKTLIFHTVFLATAIAHFALTNYKDRN